MALDASGHATMTTAALALGTHSLTARHNGSPTQDPSTSAIVNAVVQSAAQIARDLEDYITTNHLGTGSSLLAKLRAVEASLARGNLDSACGQLEAFINEVSARTGRPLTLAQAKYLIAAAHRIELAAGCSNESNDEHGQHGSNDEHGQNGQGGRQDEDRRD